MNKCGEQTSTEKAVAGAAPLFGCDWQGNEITEQEPQDTMIWVWEISPHPTDSSFDSCLERQYQTAVELAKMAIETWVDQADEDTLKVDGITVKMNLRRIRLDEYEVIHAEGD